ncbi:hypothetical protein KY386_03615 [Candidatus Parcubacteria bacterium]|nr:hypothetical protein [Candidatus Parcubacteria bacterium]
MGQVLDAAAERAKRLFWDHTDDDHQYPPYGIDNAARETVEIFTDDEVIGLLVELYRENPRLQPHVPSGHSDEGPAQLMLKGIACDAIQTLLQSDTAITTEVDRRWEEADRAVKQADGVP